MSKTLSSLQDLTQMILDAELAELRARSADVAAIRTKHAALAEARHARTDRLKNDTTDDDLAFTTGQDALWHVWLERETRRLGAELALAAARQEEQRLKAKHAFGRVEALGRLRAREATDAKIQAMRRAMDQMSSQ
jgi:hypothetical protein